ncbi:pfs domain-containing protein [Colletotrichum asianum]|uniref:Pfs domain-containing protein n=1 Tax=Colletotrichum asianum TaxID=702518 RepID=A0A8H3ZRN0_9PEZI|nr:pfs domain-containing protein [Colletotrichum asianum]
MCYLEPKIAATQSEQTLCECLEEAQDDDRDFEFYVPKESQEGIHVPRDPYSLEGRKEDPPLPNDNTNLWDLIVDGWFAKRPPMDLLIKTGQRKIELGIEQRRRLCVKLILGLMLSIDNDYPIVTWSPTSIFFLGDPVKNDLTPCVSICRVENNASQQESSILLAVSENSNVSNEPELLGIFIVMAKTLLGIAQGERLEMIRATGAYSELQRSRITLRRTIANRIDDATGKEPDIETLPFLEAAKRCLEFESQYRKLINMESSIVPIETAWQLIFKDILTTLDSNLTLPVEDPAQFLIAKRGSHTNSICLFDGENASGDLHWVGEGTDYNDEDDSLHGTNCVHLLHKSAPEADIYVAKVFSGTRFNEAEAENIAKAIDHAVNNWNVDIISMSFGMDSTMLSPVLTQGNVEEIMDRRIQIWRIIEDAMQKASVEQCIMFAAASNAGKNQSRAFPASSRCGVICVHASDGLGNDGGINPIAASGDNFMTLGMGHKLLQRSTQTGSGSSGPKWLEVHRSGTSFATPVAAGIAATILDLARQVPQVTPWRIGAGSRRVGETPSEVFASWINGVLRGIE